MFNFSQSQFTPMNRRASGKNSILFSMVLLLFTISIISCDDDDTNIELPDTIDSTAKLSAALEDIAATTEVPGFAITVVKDGGIVLQEAFGFADLQTQKAYTNQTIQHIASVSKTFAGAAVVKAIEQGLFTMETNINDLLPVTLVNPKQPDAAIKVKHLVTHTSGLLDNVPLYLATNWYILPDEDLTTVGAKTLMNQIGIEQGEAVELGDFLAEYFLEDGDLYFDENFASTTPGSTWAYSNLATGLMGFIIESVSGMSFDEYVKSNILQPLGMGQSTYNLGEVNQQNLAKWYINQDTPLPLYGNHSYVEGGLYTNNIDFGKYLLDMTKGAQGNDGQLFSPNGYDMLFADQLPNGVVPSDFGDNHGVFWIKDGNKLRHGGNDFGISAYIELTQSDDTGYTFMTNMDGVLDFAGYQVVAAKIDAVMKDFFANN